MNYSFSVSSYEAPALEKEIALALDARSALSMRKRGAKPTPPKAVKEASAVSRKWRKIAGITVMVLGGALLLSKGMRPTAAEIWGKVATNVFYIAMIIILAFGENGALCNVAHFTLPSVVTWVLVALSAVSALVSLLGYVPGFLKQLKENKAQNTAK